MKRGTVVKSLQGHDKDTLYVVLDVKDNFAIVCDGKNKTLLKPKKKNCRHLQNTGKFIELSAYNPLYDAHIRKELKL